jgi:hypothetical protein
VTSKYDATKVAYVTVSVEPGTGFGTGVIK